MTTKELKKLSRADLLEMLIDQSKEYQLMEKRLPIYESAADVVIDVNDKEKVNIVKEILSVMERRKL